MPLNPLFLSDTLPSTSLAAIREFNDRYLAALMAATPNGWADTLGTLQPTDSPLTTYPISQLNTRYQRTEGESRFKKLIEKSFDVKTEEFDDGYEAKVYDLLRKVFAYRRWQEAPGRFVLAEEQHRHTQIARILDGTGTRGGSVGSANDPGGVGRLCVDGVDFFATTHPVNMTDSTIARQIDGATTWSNYQSSAKNVLGSSATGTTGTFLIDNLQGEVSSMRNSVPDENGQLLDVDPDTILVSMDYVEPLVNGLANDNLLVFVADQGGATNAMAGAAVRNVYKGRFNVVGVKEFTQTSGSTADWYLVDSKIIKAKGLDPWLALRETIPSSLGLRVFDESSDYFKDTGNIKMSSHIWYGFSLALPHAIRRIKGPTR
jgi:hypothetical protein